MTQPICVLGAPRCGTSTAVAILNFHPHVFILYEVDFGLAPHATHRNEEFVAWLPETESFFEQQNLSESLRRCGEALGKRDFPFRSVGTKLLWLDRQRLAKLEDIPCLYLVRDPRTWAVKNRIIDEFYPLHFPDWHINLVRPLTDYLSRLVCAHGLPNRLGSVDI